MNTRLFLALFVAVIATTSAVALAGGHGVIIAKDCVSPAQVGTTLECTGTLTNNDGYGDSLLVTEAWDTIDPGGLDIRVPVSGNLPVLEITGNARYVGAVGELPVVLGKGGSTLNGLPGDPFPGAVVVLQNQFIIQPGDPDPLTSRISFIGIDQCDHPSTSGCFSGPITYEFPVQTDLVPAPATILVPGDQKTIQAAIDVAMPGDEVVVAPDTYFEAIDFLGKAITLRSASGDPDDTIIDGFQTGSDRGVLCVNSEGPGTMIKDITITRGGILLMEASPTVQNCTLVNNGASGSGATDARGGAVANYGGDPVFSNCRFIANDAFGYPFDANGGAVYSADGGSPRFVQCAFRDNVAQGFPNGWGGAVYCADGVPEFVNCEFTSNMANGDVSGSGGAFFGTGLFSGCLFADNLAFGSQDGRGGTIELQGGATLTNCTIRGEGSSCCYEQANGPVILIFGAASFHNCVIWSDSPSLFSGDIPMMTYSLTPEPFFLYFGIGNIVADPQFVDPDGPNDILGDEDDDLRLSAYSPAIDAGDNGAVPADDFDFDGDGDTAEPLPFDLDGNPRFFDDTSVADTGVVTPPIVDMGAYERQEASVVSQGESIQAVIAAVGAGTEIVLAAGMHDGPIDFLGKAITIRSESGNYLDTTINGMGALHVVQCVSGEGPGSVLRDVTITGGNATGAEPNGGGMRVIGSSPTIIGCCFTGNTATGEGGGMSCRGGGAPTLTDCVFDGNISTFRGGGLHLFAVDATVTGCSFTNNTGNDGGGLFVEAVTANISFVSCRVVMNTAGSGGGGMFIKTGSPTLTNCVLLDNLVQGGAQLGGGIFNQITNTVIVNCTFVGNGAVNGGGGMFNQSSPVIVRNSILWGNSPQAILDSVSTSVVTHSLVEGGFAGTGNVDADPRFEDQVGGDLHLGRYSPAVDAGKNDGVPDGIMTDLGGYGRFVDDVGVVDTGDEGSGPDEIVDMGAYERQAESFIAELHWTGMTSAEFALASNWMERVSPAAYDAAIFDLPAPYDVNVTAGDVEVRRLLARSGSAAQLSFDVFDRDVTILEPLLVDQPSLLIDSARLNLRNVGSGMHGMFAYDVSIGHAKGSVGTLIVRDPNTLFCNQGEMVIGRDGYGTFRVLGGATALTVGDVRAALVDNLVPSEADASIRLDGSDTTWATAGNSFELGVAGRAELLITGGAQLTTTTQSVISIGDGSSVTVAGPGSSWQETSTATVILGNNPAAAATLRVLDGGTMNIDDLAIGSSSAVSGDGSIEAEVLNAGTVLPGAQAGAETFGPPTLGTLEIVGSYEQVSSLQANGGRGGALCFRVADDASDTLLVSGDADIGGGVFLELFGIDEPVPGQELHVLSAGLVTGSFDVAFAPGLAGGKFMQLGYAGPGGIAEGLVNEVMVEISNLDDLFGLDPANPGTFTGLPGGVAVADFDGMNGPDLAILKPATETVLVLYNAGTTGGTWNGFAGSIEPLVGSGPTGIDAGSLNPATDALPDIVVSNGGGNTLSLLTNDGLGGFAASGLFVGTSPQDVRFANVGGSTALDLLVINQTSPSDGELVCLENDGNGGFTAGPPLSLMGTLGRIDPEDVNKDDTVVECVAVTEASGQVYALMNSGGTPVQGVSPFTLQATIPVGADPADVQVVDFLADGLPDIVTANRGDGTVSVIRGTAGPEPFAPAVNLPVGVSPSSLTITNLEAGTADVDLDIAVIADGMVRVLRNDAQQTTQLVFADAETIAVGANPLLITATDVDGDAQDDLVVLGDGAPLPAEGADAAAPGPVSSPLNVLLNTTGKKKTPCIGDTNGDGVVNVNDLNNIILDWGDEFPDDGGDVTGPTPGSPPDGVVNVNDLNAVIVGWGACP